MRRPTPAQPATLASASASASAFPTIDPTTLRDVQGGCGKKCTCAPQPAPQPAPMSAPAPMGPEVSTSVSISYQ